MNHIMKLLNRAKPHSPDAGTIVSSGSSDSGARVRWLCVLLTGVCCLNPAIADAQSAQPAAEKKRKERPRMDYDADPNAPGLSRADRIKRQEALIRKRYDESKKKAAEERRKMLEQARERARERIGLAPNIRQQDDEERNAASKRPGASGPSSPDAAPDEDADVIEEFRFMTLYLSPGSGVLSPEETFITEVRLLNIDRLPANRVELVIRYAPGYLEPLAMHHDAIHDLLAEPPVWNLDAELGEITYTARLKEPIDSLDMKLLEIEWKALRPADHLEISLGDAERFSGAFFDDICVTQNAWGPAGPVVGATIRITDPAARDRPGLNVLEDSSLSAGAVGEWLDRDAVPPALRLRYTPLGEYSPGDWVVFDIEVDNPDGVAFDEVRMRMFFDPEVIEFVDTDEHNWIARGVNILDGPFRDRWNWDTHLVNEVDNERGLIRYHARTSRVFAAQPSGVFARAFGRIKAPTADPLLIWDHEADRLADEFAEAGDAGAPTSASGAAPADARRMGQKAATGIYLLGRNLLALSNEAETTEAGAQSITRLPGGAAEKADPAFYRN